MTVTSTAGTGRLQRLGGVLLAGAGGVGLAVQGQLNGRLGQRLHDGPTAALVSFGSGLLVLAVLLPVFPAGRRGLRALWATVRGGLPNPGDGRRLWWWQCLGGVCGAFLVTCQGLTVAALGVAVFTVAVVAGQAVSSLAVDRLGAGPAGVQPLTWLRVLGAALAVLAVFVAVSRQLGDPAALGLAVLPALAGMATAWQQAVNGRVRAAADSTFVATLLNFATGAAALLLVTAVRLLVTGLPGEPPPGQWWLYLGGIMGIGVVATAVVAVRLVGVLLVGLASVAGQLVGALLLDLLLPAGAGHVASSTLAGTALILVAVAVAALPARRRR
ncbi:DMT family transporter [Kutzneria albida]|uniref:Transporter family-2 protein n=1 Tax=Kutzneria albida DSM 43870 TaxID=1449976 RepID=W5WJQ0_9PSEU|nr:DMT family transporter [Kutzneria albida]AHI01429.1 hypothetical protein KALB_8071 [Kutzneria albida DSM 43870]